MSTAKNATFLFYRDFMEYHQDRFDDYSLMIYANGIIVAVFPANIKGTTLYSHQGLTYGGLVVSQTLKLHHFVAIFRELLTFLYNKHISVLKLKLIPSIYASVPSNEIDYLLYLTKSKLYRRDTLSVVVIDQQLNFSKDRLTGNKRGIKNNLVVKEVQCFKDFWNSILIPNLKIKHEVSPVHSLEEITLLKQYFPKNIRQFNVYYNDKIVAGTTIFESKYVAHSQYISSNDTKNKLGSLDFLHHYLIKEVFKSKKYFDFGISNQNLQINAGLLYWKECYGARTLTQDFYEVSTKNHILLENVLI